MMNEIDVSATKSSAREFALANAPRKTRPLLPNSPRGREIQDLLRKEFGLPEKTRWFQIRFAIDEPVLVTCEYMPVTDES